MVSAIDELHAAGGERRVRDGRVVRRLALAQPHGPGRSRPEAIQRLAATSLSVWVAGLLVLLAWTGASAISASAPAVIPLPQKVEGRAGEFRLQAATRILVDAPSGGTGEYLAERLRKSTGYPLKVEVTTSAKVPKRSIWLTTKGAQAGRGAEAYQLTVAPDSVVIRASGQAGLFYGVQTLLQLLPPEVFSAQPVCDREWKIACVQIEDEPRFKWRGFLLDVSRHFFTKEEVKQFLDLMALHKLNTFHWHLVDGIGWRIEIKRYPRLTEVGAWRNGIGYQLDPKSSTAYGADGRYGGYYTQADIREMVAYAQARHITIVPEIEMPGHIRSALAAYPELSCFGGAFNTEPDAKLPAPAVYCAGNEQTFEFLQNVLAEVIALFPGKYIHIGGDEVNKESWQKCPKCQARMRAEGLKTEHELQSYFTRRIEKFLDSRDRTPIGWSEICQGGLAQHAAVMDWIGGAVEAAGAGHDVVMSPNSTCYLDHWQSTNHVAEPPAFGGDLPLAKVYAFEPVPANLDPRYACHILGAQGNLWTEHVASLQHAEYMTFPRLCALAEVAWSPKTSRNYDDFARRLQTHSQRLDQLGVNRRPSAPGKT
jgi:hexosaminidase